MHLIAFTGLKGSGKDTAASVLIDVGFEHVKLAGALKGMLRWLLEYQGVSPATAMEAVDGGLKETASPYLANLTPRWAMQSLGTEWGRNSMNPDFWVNITRERVVQFDRVVVSDVRFPNEVEMVHKLGGLVYRVERGENPNTEDLHESERLIPTLDVDGVIKNTQSTAADFQLHVARLLMVDRLRPAA